MLKETENMLCAFNKDAKKALEQYLTACEIDGVEPNPQISQELTMYPLVLIASFTYEQKPMVENTLTLLGLFKHKDYFYDLVAVFPNGFNLYVKVEFSAVVSLSLFNVEQKCLKK